MLGQTRLGQTRLGQTRLGQIRIVCAMACAVLLPLAAPAFGQKPPGKPAPRLADGKTDFGGKGVWSPIWVQDWADTKYVDRAVDVPFSSWGLKTFQDRRSTLSKDDPEGYCLPPGVPRYTGTPYPFQVIQLADRVVILYEGGSHMYRTFSWTAASTRRETN